MNLSQPCGVALSGLSLLVILSGVAACGAEIQHGLQERDANQIVAVLREAGIQAEKVREKGRRPRYAVRVPSKQAARAFRILRANELPPRRRKGVPELFGRSALVPTATEQHVKMVYALGSEIGRTLEQMEGVLSARVHLVIPARRGLSDLEGAKTLPRASVFLKLRPGVTPVTVPEIKSLVAGAVAELRPEAVSVVMRPGPKLTFKTPLPSPGVPRWLAGVALAGCIATLLLGILVVVLAVRLKREREQKSVDREWTGTERSAVRRTTGTASTYES